MAAQEPGALLFIKYAFPPNQRGYCGPADSTAFFEYGLTGTVDRGLVSLARDFSGAWPYLELISGATGIADPLDRRVVEAYWVGNPLLDRIGPKPIGLSMEERFRRQTGRQFAHLSEGVAAGGVPHHSFHVFCVYPWVGLLSTDRKAGHALTVLDRCRIRWGKIRDLLGDQAVVDSRPLVWDGRRLRLGDPSPETVVRSVDGAGLLPELAVGDWVSLHWEWICDRLGPRQLAALKRYTAFHLSVANTRADRSSSALVLG